MTQWQAGDITTKGVKIHFQRTGGDKPPLIMLHGITDNGACWERVAEVLAADFDCIMLDARGHGLSDAPETGYSDADHAVDVIGVMDGLGLASAILMGHSMGGVVAAYLAATQPERVRALVLEDPALVAPTPLEQRQVLVENWRANLLQRHQQTREQLLAENQAELASWGQADIDAWVEARWQVRPQTLLYVLADNAPWRETWKNIQCPTLLVYPEKTGIVSPDLAAEVAQVLKGVQLAPIPNAGHSIRRDQFEAFCAVVQAFLA